MQARHYEISAAYLLGFKAAYERLGLHVETPFPPDVAQLLAGLRSNAWWPADTFEDFGQRLLESKGEQPLDDIGFFIAVPSTGPLLKATVTLNKNDPATLLTRFEVISGDSIRGVVCRFERTGERAGDFLVRYPDPNPPRSNALLWRGALRRLLLAVSERSPRIDGPHAQPPSSFRFHIEWA